VRACRSTGSDRSFDPSRQFREGWNNARVEINAVIDKQSTERSITAPQIGVRQIHCVNKINSV